MSHPVAEPGARRDRGAALAESARTLRRGRSAARVEPVPAGEGAPHLRSARLILTLGTLLVIAVGIAMRLYALGAHPYGMYHDEAFYGLDALSVLHGAHALYFPANNGREPIFIYLMATTIRLFGRDELGVRAAAAVCGLLTLPATYLLGRAWANHRVGLLTAAILAGMLWHVHLSRIGFRVVSLPLFVALALGLGALALRSRSRWLLAAAGATYGLCFYTYLAARFTPIALLAMGAYGLIWHRRQWRGRGRDLAWLIGAAAIVALPLALFAATHADLVLARNAQVAIWNERIAHGDPMGAVLDSTWRTLGMFTWRGDGIARHNVPNRPIFDPLLSILFLAGVAGALAGWRRRPAWALSLIWVAVMSLPTLLAEESPHFLRAVGVLPVVALLPALALDEALHWLERRGGARSDEGSVASGRRSSRALLPSLAALGAVLLLATGAALSASDYFGDRAAPTVRLSGFDYAGCYRTDPTRAYYFQSPVTDLAHDANTAPGAVYLDRIFWEMLPSIRFLVPASDRLSLYQNGEPRQTAPPPFTVLGWPQGDLPRALRGLPPGVQITVTPGPQARFNLDDPLIRLYVRWTVAPLASPAPPAPLARFDRGLTLLDARTTRMGDTLTLRLRWMTDRKDTPSARLRAQIIDADGRVVTETDEAAGTEYYPPASWTPGSVVAHDLALDLPRAVPASLRLRLRLYDAATGRALAVRETRAVREEDAILVSIGA